MALTEQQQMDMWEWLALLVDPNTPPSGRASDRFHFPPVLVQMRAKMDALAASVAALSKPVGFTDEQAAAIATTIATDLVASGANGLTEADHTAIQADVQASLVATLKKLAGTA